VTAGLDHGFDAFLAGLDLPLAVVTAGSGDEAAGCLVSFHCQVSIAPPRYLVALSPRNHTAAVAATRRHLAVHTLPAARRDLAERFGGRCSRRDDTFSDVPWRPWRDGTPILADAAGWVVGATRDRHELGDHVAWVLDVVDASAAAAPTVLTTRRLGRLAAAHAP
jgi:flavin reductase (DIM6/NTAB) family NADH-FMN oxidoreductase RutF